MGVVVMEMAQTRGLDKSGDAHDDGSDDDADDDEGLTSAQSGSVWTAVAGRWT